MKRDDFGYFQLHPTQQKILMMLSEGNVKNPTFRQMAKALNISSTSVIAHHIKKLKENGFIDGEGRKIKSIGRSFSSVKINAHHLLCFINEMIKFNESKINKIKSSRTSKLTPAQIMEIPYSEGENDGYNKVKEWIKENY
jgi:DNA-binding Lrp family transcriptional regulator